jgi:hypothetical protein
MEDYDCLFDNIEKFVNKQGYTLGKDAERLQQLIYSIQYYYLHGIVTDNQCKQMNKNL